MPRVVLPHGGPQARDYPHFDWLVQFIASRGYAVLQPQFRGSTGFGNAFEQAGYRQWGGLMQDDVTDGVQAMIDRCGRAERPVGADGARTELGWQERDGGDACGRGPLDVAHADPRAGVERARQFPQGQSLAWRVEHRSTSADCGDAGAPR